MKKLLLIAMIIGVIISGLQALSGTPTTGCDSIKTGCTKAKTASDHQNILPAKKAAGSELNFFMNPFLKIYQLIIPTS